jgi:hypothetical protein
MMGRAVRRFQRNKSSWLIETIDDGEDVSAYLP